jgi:ABC-type lipoprotein release transport system permease subunit
MAAKWLLVFCFLSALAINHYPAAQTIRTVSGIVMDKNGVPLVGANVAPLVSTQTGTSIKTGADGKFTLTLASNINSIVVYTDDSATPGYDYLPARIALSGATPVDVSVKLQPASSIKFIGVVQFVDTESLSNDLTYSVVDERGEIISLSGFPLSFSKTKPVLQISGWDSSIVIMPVGYTRIKVIFSMKTSNPVSYLQKSISFEIPASGQGELLEYDITAYTIPWNDEYIKGYLAATKVKLTALKESLFYLTKETVMISNSESKLRQAETLYAIGDYTASYTTLKDAFITIRQVKQTLESLNLEAYRSVYIILGFLAVSSITMGFILFEAKGLSLLSGTAFYSVSAAILYTIYPGTMLIPFSSYLVGAAAAITIAILLSIVIPKVISYSANRGEVGFISVLIPIYTLSKRLMKRRRARTLLTIVSVALLTMSFVTLTSLSEEYGISLNRVSFTKINGKGIMVTSSPVTSDTEYLYLSNAEYDWLAKLPGVTSIATKYINLPQRRAITTLRSGDESKQIYGVVGIDSTVEDDVSGINKALIEGALPNQGEVAITKNVKDTLSLKLGDRINLSGNSLIISGVLDDYALAKMMELDGSGYLPEKEVNISSPEEPPHYIQVTCEAEEVLIVYYQTALKMNGVYQIRLNLGIDTSIEVDALAERIALERGFKVTAASEKGATTYLLGAYLEGKGLPLIIPWTIAVLSVVVTMMNALQERRREINIMSSVGLNPSHIACVFVSEASITGFIAGGVGYLAGLSLYRVLAFMGLAFEVEQKVSALWSLASIGLAVSAVLVGAVVALRNSVVITPSLTRKWIMPEREMKDKPHEILIPVKLTESQIDEFSDYVFNHLKALENELDYLTSNIKLVSEDHKRFITFIYKSISAGPGMLFTQNTLVVEPNANNEYIVKLYITGESDWARKSGTMVRKQAIKWSNSKKQS